MRVSCPLKTHLLHPPACLSVNPLTLPPPKTHKHTHTHTHTTPPPYPPPPATLLFPACPPPLSSPLNPLFPPPPLRCNPTAISLQAGSELFLRFVTRTAAQTSEDEDFDACKAQLIQRGNLFTETSAQARQTIASLGAAFIRSGATVLVHGYSRVVVTLLQHAAAQVTAAPLLPPTRCSWPPCGVLACRK